MDASKQTVSKTPPTPDLSLARQWLVHDYNETTKTYMLTTGEGKSLVLSCLSCKTKLKNDQYYLAYKNAKNKELVLVPPRI